MKRYLLFIFPAGQSMYDARPSGGWNDFAGSYDTVDECRVVTDAYECKDFDEHYAQVVDATQGTVLASGTREYSLHEGYHWTWVMENVKS